MLQDTLQQAGFTAVQADLYLACLKVGTQDVRRIAQEARLPTADTKAHLRALQARGFVTRYTAGRREFFTAEPPKAILDLLRTKGKRHNPGLHLLRQALPDLERFMRPGHERPDIAYYEGREGLVAAYEDTLTAVGGIVAVTSIDDTEALLHQYLPSYYRRRKAAGIAIRAIFPDTPMARRRQKNDAQELRESRLLPASFLRVRIEWNVYDDKVAFFSLQEEMAVIIRSRLIAQAMRTAFEVQWQMADILHAQTAKASPRMRSRRAH